MASLGLRAVAELDLDVLFAEAVHAVADTLELEYAKVLELLPDGQELLLRAGVGWQSGLVGQATVGTDQDSQAGYTLASSSPVIVEDLRSESRFRGPSLLVEHGVVSGMSVIIHGREHPFGVLGVHTRRRRDFSEDDVNFLQAVANVLAAAIERSLAEAKYRGIVEHAAEGIFQTSRSGEILTANPALARMLGYGSAEELVTSVSDTAQQLWVDASQRDVLAGVLEEHGVVHGFELQLRCKDGEETVWASANVRSVHGSDGTLLGFEGTVADITERKQAEQKLNTWAAMQAALARFGEQALTAFELDDLLHKAVELVATALDVPHARVMERLPEGDALILRAGVGWKDGTVGQTRVPGHLDSQSGYTILTAHPVVAEDLQAETRFRVPELLVEHGIVSSVTVPIGDGDIPWGVLGAEAASRRAFDEEDVHFLRAVANVLAAAIRRKEYEERLAQQRAESAQLAEQDRLRANFVASISHDLRTPLTSIRAAVGLLEQLLDNQLEDAERRLLANARRNADRLNGLIEDLLTVNQLDAGSLTLDRAPLDLREVVVEAITAVHPLLEEKGQRLEVNLQSPLPICGDEQRLVRVVTDLLANAHRYTPSGSRIEVKGTVEVDDVQLVVVDNGPGIPRDQREMIFDRFHRVDPASGGSGLGLAIARGVVGLHGGRIWVEESPEGGAAFRVVLPRFAQGDST